MFSQTSSKTWLDSCVLYFPNKSHIHSMWQSGHRSLAVEIWLSPHELVFGNYSKNWMFPRLFSMMVRGIASAIPTGRALVYHMILKLAKRVILPKPREVFVVSVCRCSLFRNPIELRNLSEAWDCSFPSNPIHH